MSSFQYPQHLLHRVIEPQWFPDRRQETESTLTALEAAEEAHAQYLQKIITEQSPTSGAVIIGQRIHGRSGTPTGRRSRQRRSSSEPPVPPEDPVTILSPPPISASQRFWNRVGSGRRSSTGTNRTERQESDS